MRHVRRPSRPPTPAPAPPPVRPWEDTSLPLVERAARLIDAADTRGETKHLAAWLATQDAAWRRAVVEAGLARGAWFDADVDEWPAKKLLRRARGGEVDAHVRSTPIHRDEPFRCANCGAAVPEHGRTARNHCPRCLYSLHVDVIPGDRAAECGGLMEPTGVRITAGEVVLRHRCRRCGAERSVRSVADGDVPDDWAVIVALSARGG